MARWYGSLTNRIDENKKYCDEIKVGTGVTEYLWSDRHAYEVTKVIDQKHVFIRRMETERIDNNGMSDVQDYKYTSNPKYEEKELIYKYNHWYEVYRWIDDTGKKRHKSEKINVSFGVMNEYYDYSF